MHRHFEPIYTPSFTDVLAAAEVARAEREAQHAEAQNQYKKAFRAELRRQIGVEDGRIKKIDWAKHRNYLIQAQSENESIENMVNHIGMAEGFSRPGARSEV